MSANQPSGRPSTLCIHAGTLHDEKTGGACSPIYSSTAFAFPNRDNANIYPRYFNTPNQRVIETKLAALEKGESAVVFGSGMAAITTLLFAYLKPGDHAIFQQDIYGGTYQFTQELRRFGGCHLLCTRSSRVCDQCTKRNENILRRITLESAAENFGSGSRWSSGT